MKILSVRDHPEKAEMFIRYFQKHWATENSMAVYDDCIRNCITAKSSLPMWYLLLEGEDTIGCAGLITNDCISRMYLYPWLCALFIEERYRGNAYGALLIERCKEDARKMGFSALYLCTDHIGFYERYDFKYVGVGYHPWGEASRIYSAMLNSENNE